MQPFRATIYIYANSLDEVKDFENAMYQFVNYKREHGVAIMAEKFKDVINTFKESTVIDQYFK
jgi:hypothetical protein